MYPAGGASINTKSPFTYMDFLYVFSYTYPRLRRTPLKRGLAVAARLYLPKNRLQASRRQRPLLKGVPRQWRGMYPAGGASTNTKSPFIIWTFCICFQIHTPRLRRTPLERGLAVAARLSLTKNTIQDYKRHGGSVETTNVKSNVTAAAWRLKVWFQTSRRQRPFFKGVPR